MTDNCVIAKTDMAPKPSQTAEGVLEPEKKLSETPENRGLGIALRIGAISAFGAMMAALKFGTAHGAGTVEILFYRNVFALPTIIVWILLSGGFSVVKTSRPSAHVTRSVFGLLVMCLTFFALANLPLAEATVISFTAPLFATILSAVFLREKVLWHRWSAIVLGFVGVLIVVRPGESMLSPVGVAVGLLAALGTAVVVLMLRQISSTERAVATVFWFNVACVAATALPMPILFQHHGPLVWLAMVVGGLMGGIAQILMTSALRFAPVSALAPFDYLQIIWATLWGYVLFDTIPQIEGVIGAVLIGASGCYVIWRERKLRSIVIASSDEI